MAAETIVAKKKKGGKITIPGVDLIHEQPQERSGKEYETEAIAAFNEKLGNEYANDLLVARSRGIPESKVPKPPVYAVEDRNYGVFASRLMKAGDGSVVGVGIVTRDGRKFHYNLE